MIFKSDKLFYTYIASVCPLFNFAKSFKSSRFSFITTEGVLSKNGNLPQMLTSLNTLMGVDHFDVQTSRAKGKYTYVINLTADCVAVVKKPIISLSPLVVDEEVVELEDNTELAVVATSDIDWPRVEAYKNTKSDKSELESYASQFGVSLKKNMKVENMVEVFKLATGVEL